MSTELGGDAMYAQATAIDRGGASRPVGADQRSPPPPPTPASGNGHRPAPVESGRGAEMYGQAESHADPARGLPAAETEPVSPPPDSPTPAEIDAAIAELAGRPPSEGEAWAEQSSQPIDPARHLAPAFHSLETQARADGDKEAQVAIAEARQVSGELLVEFEVDATTAREITGTLRGWSDRMVAGDVPDEDARWDAKEAALAKLREEWGKDFDAKIALAQRTARQAAKRASWLGDLLAAGAGNDIGLVKHFAAIGLKQARKARRGK